MGPPERLKYARARSGLTLSQVRERTKIGESSVSEFENGIREPSLSQLQILAETYRRSVAFFLAEGPIPQEVVLWRQRPEVGAENIESRFLRLCEQYHNLEVWTGEPLPVRLPGSEGGRSADRFTYADAEALAKKVRNDLSLGDRPALSLLAVLEEVCGVKVFHLDFEPTGTAASAQSETFGATVLLNRGSRRWRRNFDLAHELFHLLTWEAFRGDVGPDTTSTCADPQEEKFATCFARNLLMPADVLRVAIHAKARERNTTYDDLFDVARQFDVSTEALVWHMSFVGLLRESEDDLKSIIGHAQTLAPILEERDDTKPGPWPERYRALAIKALRRGAVSTGRFAEYLNIGRQEAMRFVEQEVTEDEEVPVTPA